MNDSLHSMRYAGEVNQQAIEWGFNVAQPGVSLKEVDADIEKFIRDAGCVPAFKNYQPTGSPLEYKHATCMSVNHAAVHGIPNGYILQDGDLLTIDLGTQHNDWFVDAARSRVIGTNKKAQYLVDATEAILAAQLAVVKKDCTFLTMIEAGQAIAKSYSVNIIPQYGGHAIGEAIHLDPFIPHALSYTHSKIKRTIERKKYAREVFQIGKTYCIEPVVTFGNTETYISNDGWTVYTKDGSLSCHTERCILVLDDGYELLS